MVPAAGVLLSVVMSLSMRVNPVTTIRLGVTCSSTSAPSQPLGSLLSHGGTDGNDDDGGDDDCGSINGNAAMVVSSSTMVHASEDKT